MNACGKGFDENGCIYFMIKEEKVSDKYIETCEKVSNIIIKKMIMNLHIVKNI